jgi:tRNA(fMet)-specific endonuclease VapC
VIYLPDTNVWSRYLRDRAGDAVLCDRVEQNLMFCVLSSIALMELEYGAAKRPDIPAFRERIERLRSVFVEVAAFDADCAAHTGEVRAHLATLRPNAQPIGAYDALLAGQAISLGAVFITDNLREFSRVPGLRCASWREAAA